VYTRVAAIQGAGGQFAGGERGGTKSKSTLALDAPSFQSAVRVASALRERPPTPCSRALPWPQWTADSKRAGAND
jgi:hypothetical protein